MTLSMLADVALGDPGTPPTGSRVLAPPAVDTMTVCFDNPVAAGDQIVVRTQTNVQYVGLAANVPPRQPIMLQLSPGYEHSLAGKERAARVIQRAWAEYVEDECIRCWWCNWLYPIERLQHAYATDRSGAWDCPACGGENTML